MRPSPASLRRRAKRSRDLARAREVLLARSGGYCEARFAEGCIGVGVCAHHVRLRSQGGQDSPDDLVWTCAPCHTEIHARPADAAEAGLIRRAGT